MLWTNKVADYSDSSDLFEIYWLELDNRSYYSKRIIGSILKWVSFNLMERLLHSGWNSSGRYG